MTGHAIPELDRSGLRRFGFTTGAIVAILFGLFLPWLLEYNLPVWPWIVLAMLGGWALVAPQSLNLVYKPWMHLGLLFSKITTPIIMGVVFLALILPVGLLMRLFGNDPMRRGFDIDSESYRVDSKKPDPHSLENPF